MSKEIVLDGDGFSEFESEDGIVAWIDVLGVERMSRERLHALFEIFPDLGAIVASEEVAGGGHRKNMAANTLPIGDAVCIAQRSNAHYAREAVAAVALYVSVNLFNQGFPNRGFITAGDLKTGISHGGTPYIIGAGVVRAVRQESALKVAGLAIDSKLEAEATTWRHPSGLDRFFYTDRLGEFSFLSGTDHAGPWKEYVDQHASEHPYLAAAKLLTDAHKTWRSGPESYRVERDY